MTPGSLLERLGERAVARQIPMGAVKLYELLGFKVAGVEQQEILACRKRFMGITGGEGAGKSIIASKIWGGRWIEDQVKNPKEGDGEGPPLLYWLVGDDYSQTTEEFNYIRMDLEALNLPVKATARVDPGYIELKLPHDRQARLRIDTKSAKDPSKITRQRPHGIILCEPGQVDLVIYERLNGRVGGKRGWLALVGTLESSMGWYPQLMQAWRTGAGEAQSFKLPSWSNPYYYPGGRNDPEILRLEAENSDAYFMERIAGEVVPPKGLVFPEFRVDLHVTGVEYNEKHPVHLWEDPGYGSHSAHALLVVQNIDHQLRVVDEIYERGLTTEEVIRICQARPWWKAEKYLVSDPHYKDQHHATHSVSDIWRQEAGLVADGERVEVLPAIERVKTYLKPNPLTGVPGLVINPACRGLLSEFGAGLDPFDSKSYHPWKWKEDRMGNVVGPEPLDQYNHACKALGYGIVYNFGYARDPGNDKIKVVRRQAQANREREDAIAVRR